MRQNVDEILEVSCLELLRRANTHGDQEAWRAFQQSLEETVLSWLHEHPFSEAACHVQSERHFVALAFERLRQATIQGQMTCETLSAVLVYLRVSLNGAILETLRDSKRLGVVSSVLQDGDDRTIRNELWDWLQTRLPNQQERRLAYLLYHCGLEAAEIMRCYPQEWCNAQEVTRLRRSIFTQLMKRPEL